MASAPAAFGLLLGRRRCRRGVVLLHAVVVFVVRLGSGCVALALLRHLGGRLVAQRLDLGHTAAGNVLDLSELNCTEQYHTVMGQGHIPPWCGA